MDKQKIVAGILNTLRSNNLSYTDAREILCAAMDAIKEAKDNASVWFVVHESDIGKLAYVDYTELKNNCDLDKLMTSDYVRLDPKEAKDDFNLDHLMARPEFHSDRR